MSTTYEADILVWANEQAALLRARAFSALDIEHIADEVEDEGKSEKDELVSRLAVLLAHLLKWRVQPERRTSSGRSWLGTIRLQREDIADHLDDTPSLKSALRDPRLLRRAWRSALAQTSSETGVDVADLPPACPWSVEQIRDPDFLPD